MKISEVAKAAGTSKDTVRHYVDLGLLQPGRNPDNGYLVFDEAALQRLNFIRMARDLGLGLPDIQAIFADASRSRSPCPRVRKLLELRVTQTRRRITELTELCERMERALDEWRQLPDSVPTGNSICRLIESRGEQA